MSTRIIVLDRTKEVAGELEATESYAVLATADGFDWADPIDVIRPDAIEKTGFRGKMIFAQLGQQAKPTGGIFELSPSPPQHCVIVPVPVKGKCMAMACFMVNGDDRTAYFMWKVATLLFQRADYFGGEEAG
ncbi:MAG: hypothetical protein ABSG31_06535 [Tepidisphaeraceae bacterium]|jgi:hypothetical protein